MRSERYLNKSDGKYAKFVANPLNHSFVGIKHDSGEGILGRL
jgi:hypothetical protein